MQYGYDGLDRIEHIHYENGVQTNYAYDCDGNISHLETRKESAVLLSFDYQYDGNGNRTAKTGIQGLTAGISALDIRYQYDVRGQLLEECQNGAAVRYAYDAAGNRIRKTEGEKETKYRYNQKNQLLQKEDADGISYFTYDRQGGIIEEKNVAGNRRFTYNSLHQQTQVETETGNIQKNRYDAEGLRYKLIENGKQTSFVYYNGELLHEKGEEAGLSQGETSYHLGAGIEAFQRDSKTFYYHQDEQLNTTLISDEKAAIRNHYQYNAFGAGLEAIEALPNRIRYTGQQYDQQTQVETETGNIQKNRYDAEGLRYELIENSRRTSFVYHNGELLQEKGEEAGLSKEATSYHLGAGIEAFQRDSKTYYYHQDEQLNTTLITDEERKLKNHYQYDAFGAGLDAIEALPNRIRYAGQQYDEQTEQYYLRARYYNSALGRFMQEDVYQGDGLNLYAYCHNNPVIYYDPSGCYEATKNLFRNMVLLNKKTSSTDLTKAMFLTLTNKKTGPSVECYQAQHIIPKEFQNNYVLSISGYQVDHAENGIFDIDGSKPKTNTLRQYLAASGCSTEDIDKYVSDLTHHGSGKHDSGYHKAYSEYVETKLMQLDKKYGLSEKMEMQTGSESNKRKAVRNQLIASGEMELLRSDLLTLNNYLRNKNQSGIDLYYKHSNNMTTKDYTIGGLVTPEVVAKYRKGNFDDDIDLYSKEELKSEGCGSV